MRHGGTNRRSRNRGGHGGGSNNAGSGNNNNNGGRRSGGGNRMQVFDSNGPEVRIRGTAYQVCEKYLTLAKDAAASGDRVLSESYLQHAEHYQRLVNSWADEDQRDHSSHRDDVVDEYGRSKRFEAYTPQPSQGNTQEQPTVSHTHTPKRTVEDDLGLPASIIGQATVTTTQNAVMEDA